MAAVKDDLFVQWSWGVLALPDMQKRTGLNDRQKAEMTSIEKEFREKLESGEEDMHNKSLAIFTPEQQQKLREELDRRGW